jgi:hypothetical protein
MRDTEYGDRAYRHRFSFRKKMIFIPFLAVGALALISYIVMLLWNALIPVIFHITAITFWQAAGILILSKILFGFGGGHKGGGAPWMRHRMERFKNMSPEERERFKEQMRERCGNWGHRRGDWDWDRPAEGTTKPAEDAPKPVE